jgi:hypothetical protein
MHALCWGRNVALGAWATCSLLAIGINRAYESDLSAGNWHDCTWVNDVAPVSYWLQGLVHLLCMQLLAVLLAMYSSQYTCMVHLS